MPASYIGNCILICSIKVESSMITSFFKEFNEMGEDLKSSLQPLLSSGNIEEDENMARKYLSG